jgi:hypothetical protein
MSVHFCFQLIINKYIYIYMLYYILWQHCTYFMIFTNKFHIFTDTHTYLWNRPVIRYLLHSVQWHTIQGKSLHPAYTTYCILWEHCIYFMILTTKCDIFTGQDPWWLKNMIRCFVCNDEIHNQITSILNFNQIFMWFYIFEFNCSNHYCNVF